MGTGWSLYERRVDCVTLTQYECVHDRRSSVELDNPQQSESYVLIPAAAVLSFGDDTREGSALLPRIPYDPTMVVSIRLFE